MVARVYATKSMRVEAMHWLENYPGKCSRPHGHSFKIEVTAFREIKDVPFDSEDWADAKNRNAEDLMVADFSELRACMEETAGKFDHGSINRTIGNPTAEMMAVYLYWELCRCVAGRRKDAGTRVESVRVWETETSYAEYRGE
jgi:6-pyruvoyltetrahydropterin/6-carboxytetrahydropterin synthase